MSNTTRHSGLGSTDCAARWLAIALACLSAFALAAQAAAPPPPLPPEVDNARLEASYNSGTQLVRDSRVDAYLAQIVERLALANPDVRAASIRIHALKQPLPYAFGLDNGAVYVSTGLLARLSNDSQLAGLIAGEIAPITRHDNQNSQESARQRTVRRAIPNILLITVTAGLGAIPLADSEAKAQLSHDQQLRLASDEAALRWMQAAGYDPAEVPRGLEQLRDALTAENRFGLTEIASQNGLRNRIDSFTRAQPPAAGGALASQNAPATPATQAAPATAGVPATDLSTLSRNFTLEIALEDLSDGNATGFNALLDRLDAQSGANGQTAFLRAEFVRRSMTDLSHLPEAIKAYEACISFADAPAIAYRELGFLYRRQGNVEAARRNFEGYLRHAPNAADAPIVRSYIQGT